MIFSANKQLTLEAMHVQKLSQGDAQIIGGGSFKREYVFGAALLAIIGLIGCKQMGLFDNCIKKQSALNHDWGFYKNSYYEKYILSGNLPISKRPGARYGGLLYNQEELIERKLAHASELNPEYTPVVAVLPTNCWVLNSDTDVLYYGKTPPSKDFIFVSKVFILPDGLIAREYGEEKILLTDEYDPSAPHLSLANVANQRAQEVIIKLPFGIKDEIKSKLSAIWP